MNEGSNKNQALSGNEARQLVNILVDHDEQSRAIIRLIMGLAEIEDHSTRSAVAHEVAQQAILLTKPFGELYFAYIDKAMNPTVTA